MKLKLAAVIAATAIVAACASKPQPVIDQPAPAPAPAPAPRPAPAPAPVMQEVGPLPGSLEEFQEVAGDRVYFGYDRYDLADSAAATLARQASWLTTYSGVNIIVEGHADERGTREYNLALGARRANSVKDFLVARGVAESRIKTVSYGKERPIAAESNERAWSLNRNAHTRVLIGANANS